MPARGYGVRCAIDRRGPPRPPGPRGARVARAPAGVSLRHAHRARHRRRPVFARRCIPLLSTYLPPRTARPRSALRPPSVNM
eukprot:4570778-Prymnesium_polylepis.2